MCRLCDDVHCPGTSQNLALEVPVRKGPARETNPTSVPRGTELDDDLSGIYLSPLKGHVQSWN